MTTKQVFASGWTEIAKLNRLRLATYVVEEGYNKKLTTTAIEDAMAGTDYPMSAKGVRNLRDLYAFSKGAGKGRHAAISVTASEKDLRHAISQYQPDVSQEDAEKLARKTGASVKVAKRMLEIEQVGEALKDEGHISNGELTLANPDKEINTAKRESRQREAEAHKSHSDWMKAYERYAGQVIDFLAFLRTAKQDAMLSESVPRQLKRFAAQLETQADRYIIGVSKTQAREAARSQV